MIDAHHHYWVTGAQEQPWRGPEHAAIARDFLPADLAPQLKETCIDATVLVQSVDTPEENDRLHEHATSVPTVAGVVGYLPLRSPSAARHELDRADTTWWKGVRCLVGREPLDWLAEPETLALFEELAERELVWDVVPVTPEQVEAVTALARAVPQLRIIVDHLARPPVETGERQAWEARVAILAACPGIAMKVSVGIDVLTTWGRWDAPELQSFVTTAIEHFGPGRLLLASNWPVVELAASYRQAIEDLGALVSEEVDAEGRDLIRGEAAVRWYGLD